MIGKNSRFNFGVQYLQTDRADEGIAMLEEAAIPC
jgi:hypothetical protein